MFFNAHLSCSEMIFFSELLNGINKCNTHLKFKSMDNPSSKILLFLVANAFHREAFSLVFQKGCFLCIAVSF